MNLKIAQTFLEVIIKTIIKNLPLNKNLKNIKKRIVLQDILVEKTNEIRMSISCLNLILYFLHCFYVLSNNLDFLENFMFFIHLE